ncbi:hypothetical protein GCM10007424_07100 [Flavobacterium suaedae]|uniref:Uncharacterized protein n=1 Tax=Flavobacterium suaedae TaxID=1767027 RepID=A0ABQ1JMM9_9FLAO|nr:hypothetical protein GCM10007424_07100 [Flavobacterium suaedae]
MKSENHFTIRQYKLKKIIIFAIEMNSNRLHSIQQPRLSLCISRSDIERGGRYVIILNDF